MESDDMGKVPMCRAVGDESSVYQFRIFFTRTYFLSEKQEKKFSEKKRKRNGVEGEREKNITVRFCRTAGGH